jgi:predicted N-acetyltransferase YhbS
MHKPISFPNILNLLNHHSAEVPVKMRVEAADPKEYAEICTMVAEAFNQSTIERKIIETTTQEDPNFKTGDLRVAKADGKIVGMMMLIRRPLRIGTTVVNGAIVAPVAVHPDYQKQGYCSAVMRNAVQYMKVQGFEISILWGAPWLYPQYGYSPAMLKTELVIKSKPNGSVKSSSYEFQPFQEADLEQLTQIYNSNNATRTCAEVRSPTMYEWRPGGSEAKLEVLTDRSNEVIGYRALGRDWEGRACAHEIGVLNEEACEIVFHSILEIAARKDFRELTCAIHPYHPFSRFAFWRDGEIRVGRGGGAGVARVLDLVSLLKKMKKELELRLGCSELHDTNCTLKISSDEDVAVLEIEREQVSVITDTIKCDYQIDLPLAFLNPLITGYKDVKEIMKDPRHKVNGGKRAIRLMEILFPTGFPYGGFPPLVWE